LSLAAGAGNVVLFAIGGSVLLIEELLNCEINACDRAGNNGDYSDDFEDLLKAIHEMNLRTFLFS
jgi:hypothetical protein